MVSIERVVRKSAVLTPSILECLSHLPTINLTAGCAHKCLYCYARGYSQHPGENKITLYANTFEKLRAELGRKRKRPTAVYFSPSSDIFQPVPEVLDLAYDVFQYLLNADVGVAFVTKGRIPERHMKLLQAHPSMVRAGIGLVTLDKDMCHAFEPHAAPPELRLSQAETLVKSGIATHVRLVPILPGLTDDASTLNTLCGRLSIIGIKRIAIGTLFLRRPIIGSLRRRLADRKMLARLLKYYEDGVRLTMRGANTSVLVPPTSVRREIYARAQTHAQAHGITALICACTNGDLGSASCKIAGDWSDPQPTSVQGKLFD